VAQDHAEPWPRPHQVFGQRLEPGAQGRRLTQYEERSGALRHQAHGALVVRSGQGMPHSFGDPLMLLEPRCCPLMQPLHLLGSSLAQAFLQELRKERMVAIPLALLVEGHQKEVVPFRLLKQRLRLAAAGHRRTQWGTEPLEQRGLEQEALHGFWLAAQHLLGQEVNQVAMAAAEAGQNLVHIAAPQQREGCQLQSRHPPFSACCELGHLGHLGRLQD